MKPRSRSSNRVRRGPSLLIGLSLFAIPAIALAEDDVVLLNNGGRLRGVVAEEDPVTGVTIKLVGGEIRKIPAKNVKQVIHGADVPAVAPPPPTPQYVVIAPASAAPAPPALVRRSPGLYGGGIAMAVFGALAIPGGAALIASDTKCNPKLCPEGATLIITGALLLGGGIAMSVIGGARVPPSAAWLMPATVSISPRYLALGWEL